MTTLINSFTPAFAQRLARRPNAWAAMRGQENSRLVGTLKLYQTTAGGVAAAEFWGLPQNEGNPKGLFKLCIYSESEGEGVLAAELPTLLGNRGYAWGAALSSRFTIRDVMGCTAALLVGPGSEAAQPSGGAGEIIARGTIK